MKNKNRFLFIVRYRENYDGSSSYDGTPASYGGLYHSALFVVQMLRAAGLEAKLVQVKDNNDIDREVTHCKPTHVIIEALWVVPEKFAVLIHLHSKVKWIIRCHSEIPFLSLEGIAMSWIVKYLAFPQVSVSSNSAYGTRDFRAIARIAYPSWTHPELEDRIPYLPNYYPVIVPSGHKRPDHTLDIGCFGALRPLKNQLSQALAALEFARSEGRPLNFHVNSRCEQGATNVLENIRALFASSGQKLIEHTWQTRSEFLHLVSQTDIGMQVSFSETFDITAADTVSLGVPLVTSNEVTWSDPSSQASPTNVASIVAKLGDVTGVKSNQIKNDNLHRLRVQCDENRRTWLLFD